jgi:hypothetical protein
MKIKGITMQDLLESIKMAQEREKYVKEALARGGRTLVLDENVESLRSFLLKKNYDVDVAYGRDEQIKRNLLNNKIFITNNEEHFIDRENRLYYNYGLVIVPQLNSQILADSIEKCLTESNFKSNLLQIWKIYQDGNFKKID